MKPSIASSTRHLGTALALFIMLASTAMPAMAQDQGLGRPPAQAMEPGLSGKGWRVAARAPWIVDPPDTRTLASPQAGASGPRNLENAGLRQVLVDIQASYLQAKPQTYFNVHALATEASTLGHVSQVQIRFNPAFQTVVLHKAGVVRNGVRFDRLPDARIELMRREQRLEELVIDGGETLLVLLNDVRVNDVVEIAYTVEGENPIFEGHISTGVALASSFPIDMLHYRLSAPLDRKLSSKSLSSQVNPERINAGDHQVLRVVRTDVPAIIQEQGTPPWHKVYPSLQVSEYTSWSEVDAWAQKLFARPVAPSTVLDQRVAAFRASGLSGEALVAEVLRFVQDEIRYFSASLGESSHRPKLPERTLTDRLGDCKDKVVLLNALLTALGFDARPMLVSVARNRGIAQFLPSHDEFDHVITRLELNGSIYHLDATVSGQGTTLATRGYLPYGFGLVVGSGKELQAVKPPPYALDKLEFEQSWDVSQPGAPAKLKTVMRAHGLMAERLRSIVATDGTQRLAQWQAGLYVRVMPGLTSVGAALVGDDRRSNRFEMTQSFEHPNPGQYERGTLELELTAIELLDTLSSPQEARRKTPYMISQPQTVESRIYVTAPRRFKIPPPPASSVVDQHFRFDRQIEISGNSVRVLRRIERRSDEVLPGGLDSFRENLLKARHLSSDRLRLALVDSDSLGPQFDRIDRRLQAARGFRADHLHRILVRNEVTRLLDSEIMKTVSPRSLLAAQVLASRAQANNLLGSFQAGLADANAALAIDANSETALEARAVALLGANRLQESLATFSQLEATNRRASALSWIGAIELLRGQAAEAEARLRAAVEANGEGRDFAVLWLYLAAEQGGRRGKAAVAPYMEYADPKKLPGMLLLYLGGHVELDAVMKLASEQAEMERLNVAEVSFFIGQQAIARGDRAEALKWFNRTIETGAVPYREYMFARLQIERHR